MNTQFEEVREVVKDIIERRTIRMEPAIKNDFVKIVFSIRFLISMNQSIISSIWDGIRINETLTDFILDSTREFLLRSFNSEYTYEKLCNEVANSICSLATPASAIDRDITDCVTNFNDSIKNLIGNPWLVLLLICETIIVMEEENG